jgi:hypothetical protein
MSRLKNSHHTFDMNEYFSGERFVVGGMVCDWETEGDEIKNEIEIGQSSEPVNKPAKKAKKKSPRAPEVN